MKRILSRRIEVAFPVYDKELQKQLKKMMDLQWSDNQKARIIDQKQSNGYSPVSGEKNIRSQYEIYSLLK